MSKYKNYGLWLSVASLIPLLLQAFGVNILPANYMEIVNSFLGVCVLAGIISSPNNGTGYVDK